jgi:raffinose/stachyose/melibiose transport system permease protein
MLQLAAAAHPLEQMNLLFMNILLVTIPPLMIYVFFNRQIVAGLTASAVKR